MFSVSLSVPKWSLLSGFHCIKIIKYFVIHSSVWIRRRGACFHEDPDEVGGRRLQECPPGGRQRRNESVLPRQREEEGLDAVEQGWKVAKDNLYMEH